MNSRSCINKAACRRNDEDTRHSARRACKCRRIGDLSAKIEAAEKGEHVGDWRARFASQFSRQFELRPIAQNHPRSFTASVSRRKKENPMIEIVVHFLQVSDS